ncbi:MAG: DUF1559 domain-containing protein [Planctomycetes bacterium]|nr:DUF1559 domain-containing protein [Planctomycetota bacterium]
MRHRAFTLVELLVVLAILALLMALLLPAFSRSRQQARAITCRSNIRDLLLSLSSYEADHQSLPYGFDQFRKGKPPGGYAGNPAFDTPGWWWFDLAGVVRHKSREGPDILRCPSSKLEDSTLDRDILCGKYGVNRALLKSNWAVKPYSETFVGTPASTAALARPGATLLLVDSGYSLICWWHVTPEPPVTLGNFYIEDSAYIPGLAMNRDKALRQGQIWDAISARHLGMTVNVGFADGHAAPLPANDLLVEKRENEYSGTTLWLGQ